MIITNNVIIIQDSKYYLNNEKMMQFCYIHEYSLLKLNQVKQYIHLANIKRENYFLRIINDGQPFFVLLFML